MCFEKFLANLVLDDENSDNDKNGDHHLLGWHPH
jgi:hypothetical protein